MDSKNLARTIVRTCLAKGANAAEAYVESGRELSVDVRNGEVETVQEASSGGAGLRVIVDGKLGFASSNDLSPAALEDAAARAVAFARIMTADESNALPDDPGVTEVAGLFDPAIAATPLEAKIALAKAAEAEALKDKRVTRSDGARYGEGEGEIVLANSHGLLKSYKTASCSYGVSVVAEKGDQKSSGSEFCSRRFYADLKPAAEVAAKAVKVAVEALDPRPVKTQRAAIIVDRDAAFSVLGGILAAVNGERVLQGASFLGKSLGAKIGSALLTLVDDGTLAKGLGSAPFDGEGVPTARRVIVDGGVLKSFMYNTAAARRAKVRSTGNAARRGFDSLPGIGAHNFFMAAGPAKVEDIVKATPRGLWLKDVTGYGINPVTGNFSGGASGFWVENGAVAFPVQGLTVAGTAAEILNGIDMVADDLDLNRGAAAPTFRIALLQIGGE